jgi:hypothetical protein
MRYKASNLRTCSVWTRNDDDWRMQIDGLNQATIPQPLRFLGYAAFIA